jgi:hypothetical protein
MDIDNYLQNLFASHDVQLTPNDGWLTTGLSYPACRSYVHPPRHRDSDCSTRVDVTVALSEARIITESFGDAGATLDEALANACHNFTSGSFHVLLSAVWNRHDDEQVLKETWRINGTTWDVFLGNLVRKSMGGVDVRVPDDLVPAIQNLLESTPISPEVHWLRVYFANIEPHNRIVEVLLDNETCDDGQRCVQNVQWPAINIFYSVRMFLMMRPTNKLF